MRRRIRRGPLPALALLPTLLYGAIYGAIGGGAIWGGPARAETYRWSDDQGRIHYGDHVPPRYVNRGYQVLNDQGVVIRVVPPAKTPEELARERREAAERAERERRARAQAAYDRFLLESYTSEEDLLRTRDRRLASLQGAIDAARHRLRDLRQRLEGLTRQAAELERQGQAVPAELRREVAELRRQMEHERRFIRLQRRRQEEVRRQAETDLARYRWLQARLRARQGAQAPPSTRDRSPDGGP